MKNNNEEKTFRSLVGMAVTIDILKNSDIRIEHDRFGGGLCQ